MFGKCVDNLYNNSALYDSLANKKRERPLSMDEAIIICKFLGGNPMDFAEEKTK